MPTINQLVRLGRVRPRKHRITKHLDGNPQLRGVCIRCYIVKPRKPNSASRKVCRLRLTNGKIVTAFIPGEKHNLQEHSVVLIHGGGPNDLPGMRYRVIRGILDTQGVQGRQTSRSQYGARRAK